MCYIIYSTILYIMYIYLMAINHKLGGGILSWFAIPNYVMKEPLQILQHNYYINGATSTETNKNNIEGQLNSTCYISKKLKIDPDPNAENGGGYWICMGLPCA